MMLLTMLLLIQDEKIAWTKSFDDGLKAAKEKSLFAVVHFTGQG